MDDTARLCGVTSSGPTTKHGDAQHGAAAGQGEDQSDRVRERHVPSPALENGDVRRRVVDDDKQGSEDGSRPRPDDGGPLPVGHGGDPTRGDVDLDGDLR